MGRDGAAGEFVGAALRWWRGEKRWVSQVSGAQSFCY